MYKVFISHRSPDKDLADKFAQALREEVHVGEGFPPCLPKDFLHEHKDEYYQLIETTLAEDLPRIGESISKKCREFIDWSDCVLIILTENSWSSSFVNQEIGYGMGTRKDIVPVLERGLQLQGMLEGIEAIPLDKSQPEHAIERAEQEIKKRARETIDIRYGLAYGGMIEKRATLKWNELNQKERNLLAIAVQHIILTPRPREFSYWLAEPKLREDGKVEPKDWWAKRDYTPIELLEFIQKWVDEINSFSRRLKS